MFIENLTETSLNYYRYINAFFKCVYSSEYSVLYPEFASTIKKEFKSNYKVASLSDVFNAYYKLTKIGKFEDALVLHLIYSLGINIDALLLHTYDSIDEDGSMRYFDTIKMKYVDVKLNEYLLRDIDNFKENMKNIKANVKIESKCFKDKV